MSSRPITCALALAALAGLGCMSHHTGPLPGEPAGEDFAELEQARVHYVDSKRGQAPVVLLHGFASSLNNWDAVRPALERDHRVIALDLKGFGWTGRPRGDYSPKAQGEMVWALLDELGVEEPVALVAHSWGSSVALSMAMRRPDRVRRIALYDAWVYAEQLPTFFLWSRVGSLGEVLFWLFYKEQPELKMSNAFWDKTLVTHEFAQHVEQMLDRPGTTAAALAAVRGQRYELVQDDYAEIAHPTLLMWGREDQVTPLWVGERLYKQLPDARLVTYPRCGHFPMIEAYSASTEELVAFLAEDLPAAPGARGKHGRPAPGSGPRPDPPTRADPVPGHGPGGEEPPPAAPGARERRGDR